MRLVGTRRWRVLLPHPRRLPPRPLRQRAPHPSSSARVPSAAGQAWASEIPCLRDQAPPWTAAGLHPQPAGHRARGRRPGAGRRRPVPLPPWPRSPLLRRATMGDLARLLALTFQATTTLCKIGAPQKGEISWPIADHPRPLRPPWLSYKVKSGPRLCLPIRLLSQLRI